MAFNLTLEFRAGNKSICHYTYLHLQWSKHISIKDHNDQTAEERCCQKVRWFHHSSHCKVLYVLEAIRFTIYTFTKTNFTPSIMDTHWNWPKITKSEGLWAERRSCNLEALNPLDPLKQRDGAEELVSKRWLFCARQSCGSCWRSLGPCPMRTLCGLQKKATRPPA